MQRVLTKLRSQRAVLGDTCPVVWPSLISVRAYADHWLDGKTHAWLCLSDGLVLRVVRNIRCAMEELIYAVSTVGPNHTTILTLCMLFDHIAILAEERAWLHNLNGLV